MYTPKPQEYIVSINIVEKFKEQSKTKKLNEIHANFVVVVAVAVLV